MTDVTRILKTIEAGDRQAAEQLLPLVYDELRKLAAARMAQEKPGQTLQPTALVHEAYVRLIEGQPAQNFESRRHFFAAAAEAMRRILVENARRKQTGKRGGDLERCEFDEADLAAPQDSEDLLALDEALRKFETVDEEAARLVKLRYFSGLTSPQAADVLGISPRTADRLWAYARAWLRQELDRG